MANGKTRLLIFHILCISFVGLLVSGSEVAASDFDGDGKEDVLWRNIGTGEVDVWFANGATLRGTTTYGRVASAWQSVGVGDFNGDGKADILWRNLKTGEVDAWFLNGATLRGGTAYGRVASAWQVVGVGDFNGDGKADILWRNLKTGEVDAWFLNGATLRGGTAYGRVASAWQVVGVGDFNGDGKADILWRNLKTGEVDAWFLNGATLRGGTAYGQVSADRQIAGIGDLNGDGKADILWRTTAYDGRVDVWLVNGAALLKTAAFTTMSSDWQIARVGDFNGDGKADLLWRHTASYRQEVVAWLLDGATLLEQDSWGKLDNQWQAQDNYRPGSYLAFTAVLAAQAPFTATIGDVNEDGWPEALGTVNDGQGHLQVVDPNSVGLGAIFAPPRVVRDMRLADFDGDGHLDLMNNTRCDITDTTCTALLFFGHGDGTFTEDPLFRNLAIRGKGETVVVADFDNDGDVDVFISYYTFNSPAEQCYLLINDGQGHFTDVADAAGVSLRNVPLGKQPEGAQAVDFNNDGRIDLYAAGHLFINNGLTNGKPTFTDQRAALGLPQLGDEGIKFLDWNNDGALDLIIHDPYVGPRLFEFNQGSGQFVERTVFPTESYNASYGVNVYDLDNDGREDMITMGGIPCNTIVHLNTGTGFIRTHVNQLDSLCNGTGAPTFADLNQDGRIDITRVAVVGGPSSGYFINTTQNQNSWLSIEVLGARGERNQFGRVVKVTPLSQPAFAFTRVVDGGSGYMSQTQYPLLIGTPYVGQHKVRVFYPGKTVAFLMTPGQYAQVFADGTYSIH